MGELTDARILVVDDEPANVRLLERLLGQAGYTNVHTTTDAREVRVLYEEFRPDLILLDLTMPHLDGVAVMGQLPIADGEYMPILVLTADVTAEAKQRALAAGAKDFLTKPFDRTEVLLRIKNLLDTRFLYRELERQNRSLEQLVAERTRQLLETEKLATMGNLLAGVAHELNNPLSVVTGQVGLLIEKAPDESVRARGRKIETAATRCVRIIKNFLAMARRRAPERAPVALNEILREAVEILAYELRVTNVEVCLELADDLPIIWADGHQLQQVVVNLLTNAHHAMRGAPPPRRLTVATRYDVEHRRVRMAIADTGPGIPADLQGRIFEPFFTTKPEGQGTGLGLPLCRGMIESHGGVIRVESAPGQGATFVIELPPGSPPAAMAEPGPADEAAIVRGKTILVVDDEPEVAALLAEALTDDGHQVDTASNGAVALATITKRHYDLIISDCGMPVLGGVEFYRELTQRDSRLANRVIFVSGDTLNPQVLAFLESIDAPRLSKPISLESVRALVRRVLRRL